MVWRSIFSPNAIGSKSFFVRKLDIPYISQILGRPVTDLDGRQVGKIEDVVIRPWAEFPHPLVEAVSIKKKNEIRYLPFIAVTTLLSPVISLKYRRDEIPNFTLSDQDVLLSRDVLDKQIIDIDGARVVRVKLTNDRQLMGEFASNKFQKWFAIACTVVILIASVGTVFLTFVKF